LEEFLTTYPEDPAADQASFSLANALLELRAYRQAIARARQFAARYPQSEYLDSFWFVIGYCHFALSEPEAALEMCRQVAETTRLDPRSGRQVDSRNKWQAVYMLGQIYHSLGQAAQAIAEYSRVADRFDDARKAIDYFTRKHIALPEVTTVRPGEPVELELQFRNVARCDTMVYRIDLLKFGLLKRNLENVTQINLAGIRPYHEAETVLGDGADYRNRTFRLRLPLREEGAYLIVCRGDDLHASGLVLVTPLAIEVQEEASSGEVRATIKDATADRYLSRVQVKIIGSANDEFVSGETDLRGVFTAPSIMGTSTVIARAEGNRYAFYRGRLYLGPQPEAVQQQAQEGPPLPQEEKADLLENLNESNRAIQTQQQEQLKRIYKRKKAGVQVDAAF
ncbi:MAG: tetratricopeptide repeat protein, partial [Pirellulales bacterium]|nr:tetratricopeptide repeat protein [Pirellulales bacterium]